jgi:aminoglycoside phosphotransferase family enzyme/predicted kinase
MPEPPTSRSPPDSRDPPGTSGPCTDRAPRALPGALLEPSTYPHPADDLELRETLISWIALAGDYAYKLKKPLRFEFLDYSTPALRRVACAVELQLNRRWAPTLYLGLSRLVVRDGRPRFVDVPEAEAQAFADAPHGGSADGADAGDAGRVVADDDGEYAVRMRRFAAGAELDALVRAGDATPAELRRFGADVAAWQACAPRDPPAAELGAPAVVLGAARDNFATLHAPGTPLARARIDALERWTVAEYARLAPFLGARRDAGRVRECHGDLHARNVVRDGGRLTAFDGIEFDAKLRWIDVASDAAFLVMDLYRLARPELACAFLDGWLEASGDHEAGDGLRWWLAYRALVRAKVDALRAAQVPGTAEALADWRECERLVALAEDFAHRPPGALYVTVGPSGSGKSWLAARLADTLPALRIRSDVERKRLAGLARDARSGSPIDAGIYAAELTSRTYARLQRAALALAAAGFDVLVDATFLERAHRDALATAATAHGIRHAWLACDAPPATLRARVSTRRGDPSEATLEVLERQLARRAPLTAMERAHAIRVDTGGDVDVAAVAAALRAA